MNSREQIAELLTTAGMDTKPIVIRSLPSAEEIDIAVKELAKQSTAPDQETPDWLEADIRRGMAWMLNRVVGQADVIRGFAWSDDEVIDFVNWFLKVHDLDSRYDLENRYILDSYKDGDSPDVWKQNLV